MAGPIVEIIGSGADVVEIIQEQDSLVVEVVKRGDKGEKGDDGEVTAAGAFTLTNKTMNDATNKIHANVVHMLIRNTSGDALPRGTPVYVSGYSSGQEKVEVDLADADGATTYPAVGLTEDVSLANNSNGQVLVSGILEDMDTRGTNEGESWEVGQSLYLSATAGQLTNVRPNTEAKVQSVCKVLRVHASAGLVLIQGAGRVNDIPNQLDMYHNAAVRTGKEVGDIFKLQGYDVDGAAYITFATVTAGNTPTMDLSSDVTVASKGIITRAYADIHMHDNTDATPINTVAVPHLVQGEFAEQLASVGFTFGAGGTGAITAFADATGGEVTVTSVDHGRPNGSVVSQSGTTDYDGIFVISGVTTDTYTITATWTSDTAAGNWYHGDNLTVDAGYAGVYKVCFDGFGKSAVANKTFEFRVYQNVTFSANLHTKRKFSSQDIGPFSGSGLVEFAEGDVISFAVVGVTDTTDFTVEHADITIIKY